MGLSAGLFSDERLENGSANSTATPTRGITRLATSSHFPEKKVSSWNNHMKYHSGLGR